MKIEIVNKKMNEKNINWADKDTGEMKTAKVATQQGYVWINNKDKHPEKLYLQLEQIDLPDKTQGFEPFEAGIYDLKAEGNIYLNKYGQPTLRRYLQLERVTNK